eukprot:s2604_g6.t1
MNMKRYRKYAGDFGVLCSNKKARLSASKWVIAVPPSIQVEEKLLPVPSSGSAVGAVNVPLFDDEARALVGTDFKRKGRYEAIYRGLQLAGPKFADFLDAVQEMGGWSLEHGAKPGGHLLVYCWRGGMRSGSMAWLFSLCGFQVSTLQGGYRSYRRWCKTVVGDASLAPPAPVLVLGGCTGVGKTAILHQLRKVGQQILDLEGLAKHRGSAFGATAEPQPSNEAFENILAFAVRRASLPLGILSWITNANSGALVMLSMSKELRVRRLVDDYCNGPQNLSSVEQLKSSINLLAKRLGGQRVKDALRLLDEGRPSIDAIDNARRVLKAIQEELPPSELASPASPLASLPSQSQMPPRYEGQCHCGEVKVLCYDDARAVSYCHCSICRRLSGAPFSCQALFTAAEVELSLEPGANITSLQTSKGQSFLGFPSVERTRCASCLAPVRGLLLGGKVAAVPLGLLCSWRGTDSPLRPMHHLYYANRVMDLRDGLPKYVGPLRSPMLPESEWHLVVVLERSLGRQSVRNRRIQLEVAQRVPWFEGPVLVANPVARAAVGFRRRQLPGLVDCDSQALAQLLNEPAWEKNIDSSLGEPGDPGEPRLTECPNDRNRGATGGCESNTTDPHCAVDHWSHFNRGLYPDAILGHGNEEEVLDLWLFEDQMTLRRFFVNTLKVNGDLRWLSDRNLYLGNFNR